MELEDVAAAAKQAYEISRHYRGDNEYWVPWDKLPRTDRIEWNRAAATQLLENLPQKSVPTKIQELVTKICADMRLGNTYNASYLHEVLNELVESARTECQQFYEAQAREYGMSGTLVMPPDYYQLREALRRKDEEIATLEKKIEAVRQEVRNHNLKFGRSDEKEWFHSRILKILA